jgi:hypothetical protein
MVSLDNSSWCGSAHLHLIGAAHARRIAEPRSEQSPHYAWQCVDEGDQQGCGFVMKRDKYQLVQTHRQSRVHAHMIALGAPDMSKGIRADGWHCLDDGDKPGCGTIVSMEGRGWCNAAHSHLTSKTHARHIAEPRHEHSRHYAWQCADEGDQQGCGLVMNTDHPTFVQRHRQSQMHANAIALGAPDMRKGIRADGWHCLDYGDKPGCGAVVSMKSDRWCTLAHQHLMSLTHAKAVAALRRKPSRKRRRASVDVESEADAPQSPAVAVVAAADDDSDESDDDADDA